MARWRYDDSYPVSDVFETRIMLEGRIAGLSAQALADGDLDGLDRATDDMERHWEMGDLLSNVEADPEPTVLTVCPLLEHFFICTDPPPR
jgi:GntR family transcriptional repressor for pyruvate dehydrogenase complex